MSGAELPFLYIGFFINKSTIYNNIHYIKRIKAVDSHVRVVKNLTAQKSHIFPRLRLVQNQWIGE